MSKKKTQPVAETKKFALKSRFMGLIRFEPGMKMPGGEIRQIEGEDYLEFLSLPGVFFSTKMFVEEN